MQLTLTFRLSFDPNAQSIGAVTGLIESGF
jgi:hypothetical protein